MTILPNINIAFGPYVFSANRITEGENSYNLSGNVTMNGWLHFSGTVTLTGDLANDYSITVTDNNGCYISFDPNLSSGLAKYYAKNSITVDFYRLGEFKLINDPRYRYNLDEYPVDNLFYPRSLLLFHTAGLLQPTLQVRPDKLAIDCTLGTTNLPFQDEILKSAKKMNIFSFNLSTNVSFSRTSIDLLIDCEVEQPEEEKDITSIFFLNNPLPSFSQAKIKLDTSSGEIVLGFTVNLGLFSEDSRFSLELGWKDWSLDSIELGHKLGEAIKVNCVVPLELNDFKVSVGNLATATSRDNFLKGLFSVELTGKMTISSMKVSEYFPAAKAFVKDLCLAEAPDTEISFRAYPLKIHGKADIKLFGEIDLLSAEITAGKYEYTNHILNVNAVETWGLSASVSLGITWEPESKFLYLKLVGTNKLDANGQFIGLSGTGTFECGARIWFVDISSDPMDGTAFVGFYRSPQQNKMRFIFGTQVTAGGKNKTNLYFINEAGNLTHTQGELN